MNTAGAETFHVRAKTLYKHQIDSCKVFFPITGGILVFLTSFVLVRSLLTWNQKKKQVLEKSHF